MALDRILLSLTEPQESLEKATELGRLGFVEWLVSVPADDDFSHQARVAYTRAAPLKTAVPAIGIFCDLLMIAGRESPEPQMSKPTGRGTRRRNRRQDPSH